MGVISKLNITDIARQAGVSTATVSRVINNKESGVSSSTRQRVQAVMDKMHYRPSQLAQGIALSRSKTIGVIIPDISNMFYPQMVRGIDDYISSHGYSMLLYNTDSDPEREKQHLLTMVDKRVDGVLLCSGVSNEAFLKEYRKYGVPLALIGRTFDSYLADACITGDNEKGMYISTQYMLSHGHRNILYIDGGAGVTGPICRVSGYRHALIDAGITPNEGLIHQDAFTIQYGFEKVGRLLDEGTSFTAIVSGSDLVAIGAIKALTARGLSVPGDIEVMGFDNIELCEIFEPHLSTISKPHYDMASEASRMLLALIDGQQLPINRITVNATMVLRNTTRPD